MTTSSRYFDYTRGKWLALKGLFRLFGFGEMSLVDINLSDTMNLLGNAMAVPPLVLIMVPLLEHLEFLVKDG